MGPEGRLGRLASAIGNASFSAFAIAGRELVGGGTTHPDVGPALARTRRSESVSGVRRQSRVRALQRRLDPAPDGIEKKKLQEKVEQTKLEIARQKQELASSAHQDAAAVIKDLEDHLETLNPAKNAQMRNLDGIRSTVNGVIEKLNANIDSKLVPDAPPPQLETKVPKASAAPKTGGADLVTNILTRATPISAPSKVCYRANGATATRRYLLDGFGIVHNAKDEKQLGPGLYAGIRPEYAYAYMNRLTDLPTVIEFELTEPANGIEVKNSELLDGKNVEQIKRIYDDYDFIYFNDAWGGQIKFHPRYYLKKLAIRNVHVRKDKEKDKYVIHTPAAFLKEYEKYLIEQHRAKAKEGKEEAEKSRAAVNAPPVVLSSALQNAPDAETWMLEAIKYREEAEKFEANLGRYASSHAIAIKQVHDLVKLVWQLFPEPSAREKFGTEKREVTGMVGNVRADIARVVDSGNLREQLAFLYNGYVARVFESLGAREDLERPAALQSERKDRRDIPGTQSQRNPTSQSALEVTPPLSELEWLHAVDKTGKLTWEPGANVYDYQMASEFQKVAESKSALVATGTSGTAIGLLQVARILAQKGATVKPDAVRLALLGWMLSAGDHTFHEIMVACQMQDSSLKYVDNYRRYRDIPPLTEDELRAHVAPGGKFPDEYLDDLIKETDAFKQMIEAVRLEAVGKHAEALSAYQLATATFPQKVWSFRLKELDDMRRQLEEVNKLGGTVTAGNLYIDAQTRLRNKYGVKI